MSVGPDRLYVPSPALEPGLERVPLLRLNERLVGCLHDTILVFRDLAVVSAVSGVERVHDHAAHLGWLPNLTALLGRNLQGVEPLGDAVVALVLARPAEDLPDEVRLARERRRVSLGGLAIDDEDWHSGRPQWVLNHDRPKAYRVDATALDAELRAVPVLTLGS